MTLMPELAAMALEKSNFHADFGDSILFSHQEIKSDSFRYIKIEKIESRSEYSEFILKHAVSHIKTSYILIIQWDGYIINPNSWDDRFLNYDYIGAKWGWHQDGNTVGNGGFSLRSKKLLEIMAGTQFQMISKLGEDELICRYYRNILESEFGIKFAFRLSQPAVVDSCESSFPLIFVSLLEAFLWILANRQW